MTKNALILSEPFGGGHTRAAEATSLLLKGWNCSVYELATYLQPQITPHLAKGYVKAAQNAPWVWGKIYSSSLSESTVIPYFYRKFFNTKIISLLHKTNPDVIIATHPLPAIAISSVIGMKKQIPLIGVATDFDLHPSWATTECDAFCTPMKDGSSHWLAQKPDKQLIYTGIAVLPEFLVKLPKKRMRTLLSLRDDLPVVLWMGGSDGIYQNMNWVQKINNNKSIQWIFVAGKNRHLYQYLKSRLGGLKHVRIYGYSKHIPALMDTADLLITKPGGVTSTESIRKELPLLLFPGLQGQEDKNYTFLTNHGLAEGVSSAGTWASIKQMLDNDYLLNYFKRNMRRYNQSFDQNKILTITDLLTRGKNFRKML
jgi:processive 1,2-diacylglycerol beta-glucosyltransferase